MRVTTAGWTGSPNLGDELVAAALFRLLQGLGAEVTAISVDPDGTARDHGVAAVPATPAAIWRQAARTDLGVFGGGGLVQDETSLLNLPYHLARPAAWRARRVPWVGVGLGAGPLHHRASRVLAGRVLRTARAVTVRDEHSARVLAPLLPAPPVVGADLAFTLAAAGPEPGEPHPRPEVESRRGVGTVDGQVDDVTVACLRGWTGPHRLPARGDRQRATRPGFVPAVAAALDEVARTTGRSTRFVALDGADDDAVHAAVAAAMTTPTERRLPDVHDVVGQVARGALVVAMRYHGLVAAVLGGRPAVALTYSPKVAALAPRLGAGGAALGLAPAELAGLPRAAAAVADGADAVAAAREELVAEADVHRQVLADHLGSTP